MAKKKTKKDWHALQKTTIRLPAAVIHEARIRAAVDKVNFQDVVRLALVDYLATKTVAISRRSRS